MNVDFQLPQTSSYWRKAANPAMLALMGDMLKLISWIVIGLFRSRASLEAGAWYFATLNAAQKIAKAARFSNFDRLAFASLYGIAPGVVNAW